MGFEYVAFRGLETGSRDWCSHVIRNNEIVYVFESPYEPQEGSEFAVHHAKHGDGCKDVAFTVDDAVGVFTKAVQRGAKAVHEPQELEDEFGKVIIASVQ